MRTQKSLLTVGLLALLIVSAGCSSINVNTDFDPTALPRVASYESYTWLPHPSGDDVRDNALLEGRVIRAVEAALGAKGYQAVQSGADFLIGWHVGLQDQVDVDRINTYYGYGWNRWRAGGGVWTSDSYVDEYTQGTLILDVVDRASNELVWRGAAEGRIDADASPDERERTVRDAVNMILEQFPPDA